MILTDVTQNLFHHRHLGCLLLLLGCLLGYLLLLLGCLLGCLLPIL
jgi:hypothetical protein